MCNFKFISPKFAHCAGNTVTPSLNRERTLNKRRTTTPTLLLARHSTLLDDDCVHAERTLHDNKPGKLDPPARPSTTDGDERV